MADYEVELKYRVANVAALRACLADIGATPGKVVDQEDTYFAHPQRDFAATDEAFRLRRVGDHSILTYKGPKLDQQTKTRQEIEVAIEPGEAAATRCLAMFLGMGFRRVRAVKKRRELLDVQHAGRSLELAIDHVDRLGTFFEIECQADREDWEATRDAILAFAASLGLESSERRSYLELLLEQEAAD